MMSPDRVARSALTAVCCVGLAAPALAQTPPPAGELAARLAAEAPPPPPPPEPAPPPPPASCGAPNCLALEISEDALRALRRGAEPAEFAEGISFSYEGERPPAVYFVAARYVNGRLAQYDKTSWIRPEGAANGLTIAEIPTALQEVTSFSLEGEARLAQAGDDAPVWTVPVSVQSFMIESPRTFLIGPPDMAAIDEVAAPADLVAHVEEGSVLLLTVAPSDRNLRAPEQTRVSGIVVPIEYEEE